jgi:hypothetical protein
MEYIHQELSIPRKQIKETNVKNRFKCIVNKNFLKVLIKSKKIVNVRAYPGAIDEWPSLKEIGNDFEQIFLVVIQNHQKVIFPIKIYLINFILGLQKVQSQSDSTPKVQN